MRQALDHEPVREGGEPFVGRDYPQSWPEIESVATATADDPVDSETDVTIEDATLTIQGNDIPIPVKPDPNTVIFDQALDPNGGRACPPGEASTSS